MLNCPNKTGKSEMHQPSARRWIHGKLVNRCENPWKNTGFEFCGNLSWRIRYPVMDIKNSETKCIDIRISLPSTFGIKLSSRYSNSVILREPACLRSSARWSHSFSSEMSNLLSQMMNEKTRWAFLIPSSSQRLTRRGSRLVVRLPRRVNNDVGTWSLEAVARSLKNSQRWRNVTKPGDGLSNTMYHFSTLLLP